MKNFEIFLQKILKNFNTKKQEKMNFLFQKDRVFKGLKVIKLIEVKNLNLKNL